MHGGLVERGPVPARLGAVLPLEHLQVVDERRHHHLLVPVAEQIRDDRGAIYAAGHLRHPPKAKVSRALVLRPHRLLVVEGVRGRLAIQELVPFAGRLGHRIVVGDGRRQLRVRDVRKCDEHDQR